MTVLADFEDLTPHTITLEPLSTVGLYGEPTYGTAASYPALVIYEKKLIAGPDNREVTSNTTVYIPSSSASAAESDRLTLPDGATPRIIKVDRWADGAGQHSVTLYCG
jgi:hypothetical protein